MSELLIRLSMPFKPKHHLSIIAPHLLPHNFEHHYLSLPPQAKVIQPKTNTMKITRSYSSGSNCICSNPPDHFLCPLTKHVMEDPVKHKQTGNTFDRQSIMEWIQFFGNETCPLTGQRLRPSDLVENVELQEEILIWQQLLLVEERLSALTRRPIKVSAEDQYMSLYDMKKSRALLA